MILSYKTPKSLTSAVNKICKDAKKLKYDKDSICPSLIGQTGCKIFQNVLPSDNYCIGEYSLCFQKIFFIFPPLQGAILLKNLRY